METWTKRSRLGRLPSQQFASSSCSFLSLCLSRFSLFLSSSLYSCMPVCLSVSVSLFLSLSVGLSVWLPICVGVSLFPVFFFVSMHTCLSLFLSSCLCVSNCLCGWLSGCLSLSLSVCMFACLSVCLYVFLALSLFLCLCLSLTPPPLSCPHLLSPNCPSRLIETNQYCQQVSYVG